MDRVKSRVWHPLQRNDLRYAWRSGYIIGVVREIGRCLKYCHQRIWHGYCDFDTFSIDDWFMQIMPAMLNDLKTNRHGSPVAEDCLSQAVFLDEEEHSGDIHKRWDEILDRMISLLGEMDEYTCTQTNAFADAYFDAVHILNSGPLPDDNNSALGHVYQSPAEYPEYAELAENYKAREKELYDYRLACRDEFFALFCKWFYDLWD